MATTAAAINSERWLDEVLLQCDLPADVGGADLTELISMPAGLGDLAIMNVELRCASIATVPATATLARGVFLAIMSADALKVMDTIGVGEWMATQGTASAFTGLAAFIDPDALVLWRQNELVVVRAPELDINAGPTADVVVYLKCVRVRPDVQQTQPANAPIQLVR